MASTTLAKMPKTDKLRRESSRAIRLATPSPSRPVDTDVYKVSGPAERIFTTHTSINRQFLHIVFRSVDDDDLFSVGVKNKKPMFTCDTYDGPFLTKWALHFYPDGHPSNYVHPDMEWFPAQYIPEDQKFASLYVRLKEGPYEIIEARMMTTVLNGDSDIDGAITTNMERFMLCPRMKVDEFHKDAAGHGWPKLFSTSSLKNFHGGFTCVVSLQVLEPGILTTTNTSLRKRTIHRSAASLDRRVQAFPITTLRATSHHTDAVLQSSDWRWLRAHRFILASKSEFFRELLLADQGVPFVYKSTHTIEQLELLLDLLYLDRIPERSQKLSKELIELARFYRVTNVVRALEHDYKRFRKAECITQSLDVVRRFSNPGSTTVTDY